MLTDTFATDSFCFVCFVVCPLSSGMTACKQSASLSGSIEKCQLRISAALAMETLTIEVQVQLEDANGAVIWDVKGLWPLNTPAIHIMRTASTQFHILEKIPSLTQSFSSSSTPQILRTGQRYRLLVHNPVAVLSLLVGRAEVPTPAVRVPAVPAGKTNSRFRKNIPSIVKGKQLRLASKVPSNVHLGVRNSSTSKRSCPSSALPSKDPRRRRWGLRSWPCGRARLACRNGAVGSAQHSLLM